MRTHMARIQLTCEMAQTETHLPFYSREAPGQMLSLLSWFNPSQQLSTTQQRAHSPSVGWGRESDGGENRKGKSEKTRGLR